jgi:DNA repair protein RecN (Recombination protein N)
MLNSISIQNLVLFKQSQIEFAPGLNVLTGETGAGKSLLLDALGLVLGGRADSGLVRAGATGAQVSAQFTLSPKHPAIAWLLAQEITCDGELFLRRSVGADGKSKAFINDVSVTIASLRSLGEMLVEIHGQHDQRGLLDSKVHRDLLDQAAGLLASRQKLAQAFRDFRQAENNLQQLQNSIEQALREEAFLRHMAAELQQLAPQSGEETILVEQRLRAQALSKARDALQQIEDIFSAKASPKNQLLQVEKSLQKAQLPDAVQQVFVEGLQRAISEVMELEAQLEELLRRSASAGGNDRDVDDRLFALRDAGRKYRVPVDGLEDLFKQTQAQLSSLNNQQDLLAAAEKTAQQTRAQYLQLSAEISEKRAAYAPKLCKQIEGELAALKMAATQLRVQQTPLAEAQWGEAGNMLLQFEVATNRGEAFGSLQKVASGGELSRLLLAMKVVLQQGGGVSTSIFDEIDTGTGGAVAEAIGLRLQQLAAHTQVLVVTHLPQIAALANHHLYISKASTQNETITSIATLSAADRAEELARMLSGAEISVEARKAAQKMLKAGNL